MKTVSGMLKRGLTIGEVTHTDFVLREPTAGDLFDAEQDAKLDTPLAFNGALLAKTLVSVGSFTGPFTFAMIKRLHPADFSVLREKLGEVEALGEA